MEQKKIKKIRHSVLDEFHKEIVDLLGIKVTIPNIAKIINNKLPIEKRITEVAYRKYVNNKIKNKLHILIK